MGAALLCWSASFGQSLYQNIQKYQKILIWSEEKNKKISNCYKSIFATQKLTCFNKKIQPNLKWQNYHHLTFAQYKKSHINLFSLYSMKNNSMREEKKNVRGKRWNWKYLKKKKN